MATSLDPRDTVVPGSPAVLADEPGGFLDCRGRWHAWTGEEDD